MIVKFFIYASTFSSLLPIAAGMSKRKNQEENGIFLLSIFSFTCDLTSIIIARLGVNSLPVIHFYGLVEGIILIWFFKAFFSLRPIIAYLISIVFLVVYLNDSLFITGLYQYNSSISSVIGTAFLVILIIGLAFLFQSKDDQFLEDVPLFWFLSGLLFYFGIAFFSDLLSRVELNKYGNYTWIFHNIANILKNILFAIGLWKARAIS